MVYLKEHLEKYPLMQIEDILKLYMQGILGPGHLVSSFTNCLNRVNEEYKTIKNNQYQEIEELISDQYVRIYLYPYYQKEGDFTLLVKYFIESSKDKADVEYFKREIELLINNENQEYIHNYISSGNYLISHSEIYRDNYDPHYLVINRKYTSKIYT